MSFDDRAHPGQPTAGATPVLELQQLSVELGTPTGFQEVLHNVSFTVMPGESVGLVGESGCGKSVTSLAIMQLVSNARYTAGKILLKGQDLLLLPRRELQRMRGHRMAMIFQEPMTSLNPLMSIGDQIAEAIRLHTAASRVDARKKAQKLIETVGIPSAARRLDARPHELSGGQRQRVVIAIALACEPSLLIADEPTTALDVTVQADILRLLDGLRREYGMGLLLITHDLALMSNYCDRVNVMYAGRIVETHGAEGLIGSSAHPYTRALLNSSPVGHQPKSQLPTIRGAVPALGQRGLGCLFEPRCGGALDKCKTEQPALQPIAGKGPKGVHHVACWAPQTSEAAHG